jgi:conserved oligomeric Golgi complex subunit 3
VSLMYDAVMSNARRLYRDQLVETESHLDALLSSANSTLLVLSSLSASFNAVETQTTEFQAQCEGILADQKHTSELAEDISQNLQYYNYLEPITRRLNAPGAGSLVLRSEFSDMLSNLDTCLDYMLSHVSTFNLHSLLT